MKKHLPLLIMSGIILFVVSMALMQCTSSTTGKEQAPIKDSPDPTASNADKMLEEGRQIFRFETFGDEAYWTDALQLNKAIAGEKNGGVGGGLSPKAALG